ncbi:META domain-containing protein [Streptomyces sp. NPDC050732]|uniref:META domain-containing protein n=1 Tax=Streptomyces sp. NPDC050732 TaxID=3154632 RepID=UPI00341EAE35
MHTQRLTLTLTALASAGLLLTACGTESGAGSEGDSGGRSVESSGESEAALTGVRWNVESLTLGGKKHDAPGDAHLKIGENGRAGGSFGCNSVGADVTIKDGTVEFGQPLTTKRACADDGRMTFEKNALRTLGEQKFTAKVAGDRMTLTTAKGDRVAFTSQPAEPDAPLTGTKWRVDAVGDAETTASLPKDVADKVHLTFGEDGKVRGSLGCNSVTAKAEAKDGRITFGAPATTRKLCQGEAMTTERKLLKIFDGTARYEVERGNLKITAADGTVIRANADQKDDTGKPAK